MTEIKQGEDLSITGVLKYDNGVIITDYTDRKISVILMDGKQNILNSWSNSKGALADLVISPEGIINFVINGESTAAMLGEYFLEFKLTDGTVQIGRQLIQFHVLNSKIGREDLL